MGMTAWQRHVHFIQTSQQFYGGGRPGGGDEEQPNPTVKTDQDVLRENYRCYDQPPPSLRAFTSPPRMAAVPGLIENGI